MSTSSTPEIAITPADDRRALGARLAVARKRAGLTLEQAAARLCESGYQVSKGGMGAWEVGRNVPDSLVLRRLSVLYDTTADALLGHAESAQQQVA